MQQYFTLNQSAVQMLAKKYGTPLLVLSLEQIKANYSFLTQHLPGVKLHYAVKANPDPRLVTALAEMGSCFDVASDGEILDLANLGIKPDRIIYANPVKTARGLKAANSTGVTKFTFDSQAEIGRIAAAIPGGQVLLRVRVDNPEALVDLNKKFGVHPDEVPSLLQLARDAGLDVAGLCFHVGSQTTSAKGYLDALKVCSKLYVSAAEAGMQLRILDIGGGFPIPTIAEEVDVAGITAGIKAGLDQYFPDIEIWAEPGRFICGTAVNLITRVIGAQVRDRQQWYFLDEGLYGSFSGILFDHWEYDLQSFKGGEPVPSTFAGPSCDSLDVLFKDKYTPPLEVGDLLLVPNCGAYTSASATVFNGFAKAPILVWEEEINSLGEQANIAARQP
jgi:ornithine decarboxylase